MNVPPKTALRPHESFRSLMAELEATGELKRARRKVDPRHELITVTLKNQKSWGKGSLFPEVTGSPTPVVTNVLSNRFRLATALGMKPAEMIRHLEHLETEPIDPVEISDAPVQEVVHTDDVDISRDIPQIIHCEGDAGPYITAGVSIARDPHDGTYNASWNRVQILGGDHARIRMMAPQHLGQYQETAEATGQPLPIALVIGAPPALMLSAASKIPIETDELAVAGAWQRSPLRVAPAVSVPVMVPAEAEFVIEGEVVPNVREIEGPYGEFTDTYVEPAENHVLRVTAITRRRDAVFHTILAGAAEDITLLGVPLQVEVLKRVRAFADIVDIGTPGHLFGCVVSIDKKSDEQARAVLMAALAAHNWMKVCAVVDKDIDPHDPQEVLWAIHTRCRPDTGLYHIPRLGSFPRADVRPVHKGKMGFDATVPMDLREVFARREFPGIETIDLDDYFG